MWVVKSIQICGGGHIFFFFFFSLCVIFPNEFMTVSGILYFVWFFSFTSLQGVWIPPDSQRRLQHFCCVSSTRNLLLVLYIYELRNGVYRVHMEMDTHTQKEVSVCWVMTKLWRRGKRAGRVWVTISWSPSHVALSINISLFFLLLDSNVAGTDGVKSVKSVDKAIKIFLVPYCLLLV